MQLGLWLGDSPFLHHVPREKPGKVVGQQREVVASQGPGEVKSSEFFLDTDAALFQCQVHPFFAPPSSHFTFVYVFH